MNQNDNTTPKPKRPFLTVLGCFLILLLAWHSLWPRFSHGDTLVQAMAAQLQNDALAAGYNAQLTPQELLIRYSPAQGDEMGLDVFAEQYRLPYICEPQALGYRLCRVGLPQ